MHPRPDQQPSLGRIVLYRLNGEPGPIMPAVIVATPESMRSCPTDQPALNDDEVHLVRFSAAASMLALGGSYAQHRVREDEHVGGYYRPEHTKGTWRWPNLR